MVALRRLPLSDFSSSSSVMVRTFLFFSLVAKSVKVRVIGPTFPFFRMNSSISSISSSLFLFLLALGFPLMIVVSSDFCCYAPSLIMLFVVLFILPSSSGSSSPKLNSCISWLLSLMTNSDPFQATSIFISPLGKWHPRWQQCNCARCYAFPHPIFQLIVTIWPCITRFPYFKAAICGHQLSLKRPPSCSAKFSWLKAHPVQSGGGAEVLHKSLPLKEGVLYFPVPLDPKCEHVLVDPCFHLHPLESMDQNRSPQDLHGVAQSMPDLSLYRTHFYSDLGSTIATHPE
ncbi:uncharacterized protein G2W53_003951 [Senna tora]|uniref:Uncharacterized protein n=1 Tax=Senna tora TaxID=362788 RepID=A0A834XC44_9FABA|nr:uncharacterized protein G2W53_003951 [Senna tora]